MPDTYHFTLIVTGVPALTLSVENALYEAGCDDATLSMRDGKLRLTFARMASSYRVATRSAVRQVQGARLKAKVVQIEKGE